MRSSELEVEVVVVVVVAGGGGGGVAAAVVGVCVGVGAERGGLGERNGLLLHRLMNGHHVLQSRGRRPGVRP